MSLTQVISRYLAAYEGHTEYEPQGWVDVVEQLSKAPLSELNSEYNGLSQQNLWTSTLIDAFYDELLNRLLEETTFSIATSWKTIETWLQKPFVHVHLGFDEVYYITDLDGNYIRVSDPDVYSFGLTNDSMTGSMEANIIRMFLDDIPVATVEITPSGPQIVSLTSSDGSVFHIYPSSNTQNTIQVPVTIEQDPEFELIRQLYIGVKNGRPKIIDLGAPVLINQLVDLPEAYDIVKDGGITFEGDILLSAESQE